MQLQKEYHKEFKVKNVKTEEKKSSAFYLTINNNNQLKGDEARCLKGYFRIGMRIRARGYDHGSDFFILDMKFLDPVKVGAKLNTWG